VSHWQVMSQVTSREVSYQSVMSAQHGKSCKPTCRVTGETKVVVTMMTIKHLMIIKHWMIIKHLMTMMTKMPIMELMTMMAIMVMTM
jgi:hypothetical protein